MNEIQDDLSISFKKLQGVEAGYNRTVINMSNTTIHKPIKSFSNTFKRIVLIFVHHDRVKGIMFYLSCFLTLID